MISEDAMKTEMNQIKQDIHQCRKCMLWEKRNNPVVGEGNINAQVMFIGEAPGKNEDRDGVPFVGRAGMILEEFLSYAGLKRSDVYITNILKCRPPSNRNPKSNEISACIPHIDKQIRIISPTIIAPLGNFATSYILKKYNLTAEKIGNIHGKIYTIKNITFNCTIIPLYHPAAVVYNPNLKTMVIENFKSLKNVLK
jgi:DNA polymerase